MTIVKRNPVRTIPAFFSGASRLRREFDSRFANPFGGGGERFVWDYWHIPQEYTLLRTPAYHFFSPALYRLFHERLVRWGRETLGCHDVTPTWLSCYVDGCEQRQHSDVPHGPWAFVYSLTRWEKRHFTGGETFLLRPGTKSSYDLIAPRFNQLAVFDPSIPHGVRTVKGIHDVREGRLVIHGWFTNPRPFIRGSITPRELQSRIDDLIGRMGEAGLFSGGAKGALSFRFGVSAAGQVTKPKLLTHTLKPLDGNELEISRGIQQIAKWLAAWDFTKKRGTSTVTLPLLFE